MRRGEAGFTLVEVLIAITIFMFGLMAVSNLFIVAGSSNQVANITTTTAALAAERMEKLKAAKFLTDLAPGPGSGGLIGAGAQECDASYDGGGPNGTYHETITVQGVSQIRVCWQITDPGVGGTPIYFIVVRAEATSGFLKGRRTMSEFTTFRACTSGDCPCPGCS